MTASTSRSPPSSSSRGPSASASRGPPTCRSKGPPHSCHPPGPPVSPKNPLGLELPGKCYNWNILIQISYFNSWPSSNWFSLWLLLKLVKNVSAAVFDIADHHHFYDQEHLQDHKKRITFDIGRRLACLCICPRWASIIFLCSRMVLTLIERDHDHDDDDHHHHHHYHHPHYHHHHLY